jgi:hypothetical protein
MQTFPMLRQVADRLVAYELSTCRTSAKMAMAALNVYAKLFNSLSPVLGRVGSFELFRRSLQLAAETFPFYKAVRTPEPDGLLTAVGVLLQEQEPEVILKASVALVTAYLELLAAFIGERLTWQLVQEAWPGLSPSEEVPE